ncbi:hypothetical protein ACOMHN_051278 [Nucella lapillus]
MSESGKVERKVMDHQDWIQRWDNRAIGFHKEFINPVLEKHLNAMVDGRPSLRILLPLCGKSWDMKWLAEHGHSVVGVELVQQAVQEFFQDHSIPFTAQPDPTVEGTLFQSEDKKIQIYCCDFFKISPDVVGYVDAVWDRGGMVAINVCDRARYAQVIQSVKSPNCRYLLSALQYDETKYAGPPHHLGDEAIREIFEDTSTVTEIDCTDVLEPRHKTNWGIDWLNEKAFLITPKQ